MFITLVFNQFCFLNLFSNMYTSMLCINQCYFFIVTNTKDIRVVEIDPEMVFIT